eukprot:TRINITY_DN38696_c1_g1_i1.p2 TRINITY_DN38696_c1_g1~~TRINITY_DN38696_c1_g1_i1.p2  ORF type:complete len:198 (-),score=6.19 TRINITY_DN38696_c1_g1_i1:22-615(-)
MMFNSIQRADERPDGRAHAGRQHRAQKNTSKRKRYQIKHLISINGKFILLFRYFNIFNVLQQNYKFLELVTMFCFALFGLFGIFCFERTCYIFCRFKNFSFCQFCELVFGWLFGSFSLVFLVEDGSVIYLKQLATSFTRILFQSIWLSFSNFCNNFVVWVPEVLCNAVVKIFTQKKKKKKKQKKKKERKKVKKKRIN